MIGYARVVPVERALLEHKVDRAPLPPLQREDTPAPVAERTRTKQQDQQGNERHSLHPQGAQHQLAWPPLRTERFWALVTGSTTGPRIGGSSTGQHDKHSEHEHEHGEQHKPLYGNTPLDPSRAQCGAHWYCCGGCCCCCCCCCCFFVWNWCRVVLDRAEICVCKARLHHLHLDAPEIAGTQRIEPGRSPSKRKVSVTRALVTHLRDPAGIVEDCVERSLREMHLERGAHRNSVREEGRHQRTQLQLKTGRICAEPHAPLVE
mmetsp:Transcript_4817/g.14712  ORF Transcript_4817/g.14712 Transcript_4817/m.14712 type:complete len:262 (-) Transcript_4817:618-1403(-)